MCGISGIFRFRGLTADEQDLHRAKGMANALAHRGPDGEGAFLSGSVALSHRRLSIIDIAAGIQPMHSRDDRWTLVYNGELYNFAALRKELEVAGVVFRTNSDTEVVVESFARWGASCVTRFNGEFGIAAYDRHSNRLHLVRDRLGIRNVYYHLTNERVVFASEAKALFASGLVTPTFDIETLGEYLALRYITSPRTGFEGVTTLPPGHRAEVSASGYEVLRYWDADFTPDPALADPHVALPEIERLLLDSIELRLMSDVSFGAYLSGGVDSSLVVAMMSRLLSRPVHAFSASFKSETGIDELPFAAAVAKHTGARHSWIECGPQDIADHLAAMVRHCDVPMADPASIPTFMVSKLAGQSVRMVLTGEGSDEIFGGYPKYIASKYTRWLPQLPSGVADLPGVRGSRKLQMLLRSLSADTESNRLMSWFGNFQDPELRVHLIHPHARDRIGAQAANARIQGMLDAMTSKDWFARMAYVDLKTWLPDDLLLRADRMCMAWSVEGRVPFLDHRLVELLARVPSNTKLPGTNAKPLLKTIAEKYLPHAIVHRKKVGFAVPLPEWIRGSLKDFVHDILLSTSARQRGILEPKGVTALLDRHTSGRADLSREIWSLVVLETWLGTTWPSFEGVGQ